MGYLQRMQRIRPAVATLALVLLSGAKLLAQPAAPPPDASFDEIVRIHVDEELGGRVPVR